MAEKKKAANKKTTTTKKAPAKKAETKKAETKKVEVKKEVAKTEVKKEKKEAKLKKWFYSLTLEKIIAYCTLVIVLLLIVLIVVATKNTKTKNGDDIVVKINGMTVTANELYTALKKQAGQTTAINMIDEYILDKEYKTTSDMKESAKETLNTYKTQYGDQFEAFLEYNGIKDEKELKELLIKNKKLTLATDDYIKNSLTEKEMKKYYEEKIKGDISAKHILVAFNYEDDATDEEKEKIEKSAKKKAEEIIEKLKAGEDFSALAKEYSEDTGSKENGGDLGYFNTGDMVSEFEDAAYSLKVNEYTTTPVKTTYGYHIIMKTGEKEKPSYKKSKDTIIEKLIAEKKEEDSTISVKAMIALRKKYKMTIKDKTVKSEYNSYIKQVTNK